MNFIDKIYIVHHKPLKDRMEFMLKQFELFNITNYKFVYGTDRYDIENTIGYYYYHETDKKLSNAIIAITISHIDIYRDIIENNYKSCLILEDDAVFCNKFDEYFKIYMESIPSDYDIAFINNGGDLHIDNDKIVPDKLWYKTDVSRTCCAYIVTKKTCEILISSLIPFTKSIDYALNDIIKEKSLNAYWCEPTIVTDASHIYGSSHNINQLGKYLDMYNDNIL